VERHDISTREAVDAWLADLLIEGKSKSTIATYRTYTKPLLAVASVNAVRDADCRAVLLRLMQGSQNTVATAHAAMASFFKWCIAHHYLAVSPLADVPRMPNVEGDHRFLRVDELRRLWDACESDEMRLMLRMLPTLGPRAMELMSIRWDDVDFVEGELLLRKTKGSKPRRLPLDAAILAGLSALPRKDPRVFPYVTGTLRYRLRVLGRKAGVPGIHPHLFRHTFGSQWMLTGGDSLALKQLGGWSDLSMVERYARSALEESALKRGRETDLGGKLFGE